VEEDLRVANRVEVVRARIEAAAARSNRDPLDVRLVAVSKGMTAALVDEAIPAGVEEHPALSEQQRLVQVQRTALIPGRRELRRAGKHELRMARRRRGSRDVATPIEVHRTW